MASYHVAGPRNHGRARPVVGAMRSFFAAIALPVLVLSITASAQDAAKPKQPRVNCHITAEKGDRVVQGKTLFIEKGEVVKDAVAIDGDVVVRAGAVVKSAVAVNGQVILEPGARVSQDAVAVGGDLKLSDGSRVGKDAVALGGELKAGQGAKIVGDRVSISIGGNMVASIVDAVLSRSGGCVISEK